MREQFLARYPKWRLTAALIAGLLALMLLFTVLERASVLPIRVSSRTQDNHTATLLADGSVLIIGGIAGSDIERYDPSRDRWHRLGKLRDDLYGLSSALIPDGRVLVIGDLFDHEHPSATGFSQLYDPATGKWSPAAYPPRDFYRPTATLLHDGTLLFVGGGPRDRDAIAVRYDPRADRWLAPISLSTPHIGHTATLLPDGRVLVINGSLTLSKMSAEIYDPLADSVRTVATPHTGYARFTATLLADGRVLIVGGNVQGATEVYDVAADTWQLTAPLATPRYEHAATLLTDGTVLVTGGEPASEGLKTLALDSAERFDPATNRWSTAGQMARPRSGHTATLLANGQVLVVDGYSSYASGSTERYDPHTAHWSMAGGITVRQPWLLIVLFIFFFVPIALFMIASLVAACFIETRWGRWWNARFPLSRHPLPLPRKARISLASLYGALCCLYLSFIVQELSATSLWPYPDRIPLLFWGPFALNLILLGIFLFTRSALTPPPTPSPAPSSP